MDLGEEGGMMAKDWIIYTNQQIEIGRLPDFEAGDEDAAVRVWAVQNLNAQLVEVGGDKSR